MKLLTNPICKFKILNNKHILLKNKKINVITSVFFKRDQYYKNFNIYVQGLKKNIKFIDSNTNNPESNVFYFLLFIDHNIENDKTIMDIINKSPRTIPVKFMCSEYMKNGYYIDLFGTLVRFFPMFDFENNPCNISICIDVDLHDEDYIRLKSLMKNKIEGFAAMGALSNVINEKKTRPYVYASLVKYNMEKADNNIIINYIKNADEIKSTGHYKKRLTTFGFGVDEIFLNEVFLEKIKYKIIIDYQISYFFYYSLKELKSAEHLEQNNKLFKVILGKYYKKGATIDELFNIIDKNTHHIRYRTPFNNEISRNFTRLIKFIIDNNKKFMKHDIQMFIHKYLKNIISSSIVIETDVNCNVTNVEKYETVYDTDYKLIKN